MTGDPSDTLAPFAEILGWAGDPDMAERLHALSHRGQIDVIDVAKQDGARRRMLLVSRSGREYRLALSRDQRLAQGAVLFVSDDWAVVVHLQDGPKLRLTPRDIGSALRLGYHCGNLHWAAQFSEGYLEIPLDGPEDTYRRRLADAAAYAAFDITRVEP